jgi:hypothetical protein
MRTLEVYRRKWEKNITLYLKEYSVSVWSGLIWLSAWTSGELLGCRYLTFGFQ